MCENHVNEKTRLSVQILKIDRKYRKLLQQLCTENWYFMCYEESRS